MEIADDWSYFDEWLADAQLPERNEWTAGFSAERLHMLVRDRLEKAGAPRLLIMQASSVWRVNPAFVAWWHDNRERIVEETARPSR